jgi:hypothetical protein
MHSPYLPIVNFEAVCFRGGCLINDSHTPSESHAYIERMVCRHEHPFRAHDGGQATARRGSLSIEHQ